MSSVLKLSKLYFLGEIRRQVHLVTLFLGVILLMLPAYINSFSLGLGAFERVAKDFGLTIIGYYGVAMAIWMGSTAVNRDIEGRSIHPILARPLTRLQYLMAHLVSMVNMLTLSLLFLALCLTASIGLLAHSFDADILMATGGDLLASAVLAAACLCFSTLASPPLAGVMGAFLYLVGGLSNAFIRFFLVEDRSSYLMAGLARAFKVLLPNFEVFRLKDPAVHDLPIPYFYGPAITLYALAWVVFFTLLANLFFERRDV